MSDPFDPYYRWLGIPPKDQPPNHYRLLSVEMFEEDPDVIEAAAERQAVYLREMSTGPHVQESQRVLKEIAAARVCLLDPKKKAAFDTELKARIAANERADYDASSDGLAWDDLTELETHPASDAARPSGSSGNLSAPSTASRQPASHEPVPRQAPGLPSIPSQLGFRVAKLAKSFGWRRSSESLGDFRHDMNPKVNPRRNTWSWLAAGGAAGALLLTIVVVVFMVLSSGGDTSQVPHAGKDRRGNNSSISNPLSPPSPQKGEGTRGSYLLGDSNRQMVPESVSENDVLVSADTKTLIGAATGNGDFNADTSETDARLFQDTDHWFNLSGSEAGPTATKNTESEPDRYMGDGTRHALVLNGPAFINNSGHTVVAAGEVFQINLNFRDATPKWIDNTDALEVFFFTSEVPIDGFTEVGDIKEVGSVSFSTIGKDNKFEAYSNLSAYRTLTDDVGKTVFVGFRAKTAAGIGRIDNFVFQVVLAP